MSHADPEDLEDVSPAEAALLVHVANLQRFASRLAHELQTPLTTVRGFSSLLLQSATGLDDATLDALERIERAAARAERSIRTMTESALADDIGPYSLAEVVATAVARAAAARPEVEMVSGLADHPSDGPAYGSRNLVERLVTVLVGGLARRAARTATPMLDVRPTAGASDVVAIRFTMPGPVMSVEERRAIDGGRSDIDGEDVEDFRLASALATAQGGKLWFDDIELSDGRMTTLLALPRQV